MFYLEHDTRLASDRINSQPEQRPKTNSPTTNTNNEQGKLKRKQWRAGAAAPCARAVWLPQTQCAPGITVDYQPIGLYEYNKEQTKSQDSLHDELRSYTSAVVHESGSDNIGILSLIDREWFTSAAGFAACNNQHTLTVTVRSAPHDHISSHLIPSTSTSRRHTRECDADATLRFSLLVPSLTWSL